MSHAVFVQKVLHYLATSRFVGNAQGFVLDVRPQAVGVDLDGGLRQKLEIPLIDVVDILYERRRGEEKRTIQTVID